MQRNLIRGCGVKHSFNGRAHPIPKRRESSMAKRKVEKVYYSDDNPSRRPDYQNEDAKKWASQTLGEVEANNKGDKVHPKGSSDNYKGRTPRTPVKKSSTNYKG